MAHAIAARPWERLARLRRKRRVRNAATLFMDVLGPVLAVATYVVMGPLSQQTASTGLRLVFLADLIYILLLTGLVGARMAAMEDHGQTPTGLVEDALVVSGAVAILAAMRPDRDG